MESSIESPWNPSFSQAFKRWITVRQGLNWSAKALLDSEAMTEENWR